MAKSASKAAASEALNQRRRFAALYVTGTDRTRGNWDESNKVLDTSFVPCDEDVRRLIEEEGGLLPPCDDPNIPEPKKVTLLEPKQGVTGLPTQEKEDSWRDRLAAVEAAPDDSDACKEYETLKDVYGGIAEGRVKTSASQVRLLMDIKDRCFGKPKERKDDAAVLSGALLLPTMGVGSEMMICPRCGYTHEAVEQNG